MRARFGAVRRATAASDSTLYSGPASTYSTLRAFDDILILEASLFEAAGARYIKMLVCPVAN